MSHQWRLSIGTALGQVSCPISGRKYANIAVFNASFGAWTRTGRFVTCRANRGVRALSVRVNHLRSAVSVPRPAHVYCRVRPVFLPCRYRSVSCFCRVGRPAVAVVAVSVPGPCRVSAGSAPRPHVGPDRPTRPNHPGRLKPSTVLQHNVSHPSSHRCRPNSPATLTRPLATFAPRSYRRQPSLKPLHPRQLRPASPNTW